MSALNRILFDYYEQDQGFIAFVCLFSKKPGYAMSFGPSLNILSSFGPKW